MATPFETLKREAVQLERQLEDKVARYQQLTQKLSAASNNNFVTNSVDHLSRAEQGIQHHADLTEQQENIQYLFNQLSDLINKKLKGLAITPSQRATSQRYQDILQDLRSDYEKSNQLLRRARERQELLAGASTDTNNNGSSNDAAMDSLLRERNHIQNSMNTAASVVGQAESVRQDLHWQGRSLRSTGNVMSQIAGNIPGVNHLVDAIRRRRSQDDKVVAGVIASCIVFTLWYLFG